MGWLIVGIIVLVLVLAVLGGMGFLSAGDDTDRRGGGGGFIDWML